MTKILNTILFAFLIISCQGQQKTNLDKEQLDQIESNQKTLDALKDAEERFKDRRDIFHWIYFKNKTDQDSFLKEVKLKDYELVNSNVIEDKFPYQLQIKINDFISKPIIDSQVIYLFDTAKKYNGDYDGWETSVEE